MEALLYKYVLALTIVMPGNTPDLQKMIPMKSLEECWQTAQAFVQAEDIGKKKPESIGLGAGCGVTRAPSMQQ